MVGVAERGNYTLVCINQRGQNPDPDLVEQPRSCCTEIFLDEPSTSAKSEPRSGGVLILYGRSGGEEQLQACVYQPKGPESRSGSSGATAQLLY